MDTSAGPVNTYDRPPRNTAIQILLDRSGSMEMIKEASKQGLAAFLTEQRNVPGECTVRLCQFDDEYDVVHESLPLDQVTGIELEPRHYTALCDSWGRAINEFAAELATRDVAPDLVIFVVVTDGLENASKEWTAERVQKAVREKTALGWKFLYLGANQDAVRVGMRYGVPQGQAMTYQPSGASVGTSYAVASAVTSSWRTGDTTRVFTEAERTQVIGNDDSA